ncbi:PREDICTED: kunitz-type serine protease inhibitor 6-like [Chrysochloris asiatica]|uniref:Kunitz-type serine protease inhibitor 6-like n=1 Tax=Chrysochloris asiatica TaxID=185453 RepID=A0A9B0WKM3_CHRAS|nr:PREDICTED: kunitz-type serine protease inhibitor 6-like [Chrysochloris asiatica]
MESSGLLSMLVLFILVPNVHGPGLNDWLFPKRCPRIQEQCEFKERDQCTKDKHCQNNMKCCHFSCGRKCLNLRQDICKLPKETGLCMAYFRRWWYDKENNTCSIFIYGGCQGNNNNFQTEALCQNFCQKDVNRCPRIRIKCEIQERSQCSAQKPCPGNLRCCTYSCGRRCLDLTQDICSMTKDKGPCLAYIPRWWYDKKAEKCHKFIYGGCQGNNNNFQSESICMISCHKKRSSCWEVVGILSFCLPALTSCSRDCARPLRSLECGA